MQGVGREQHTAQAQLGDHLLGSRDFIALDVDFGVRQQDRGLRGEGAQRLGRLLVVEMVEAALQGLAVERHDRHPAQFRRRQQVPGVLAKSLFQGGAVKHLQDSAQRVERRRSLQGTAEQGVEDDPALLQEADDVAVRGRAGQQRQHGEQQQRRQRIALALRASWIGNLAQRIEKPAERYHGKPPGSGIADQGFTHSCPMVDSFYAASRPSGLALRDPGTQRGEN